jgi:hypothetical protein
MPPRRVDRKALGDARNRRTALVFDNTGIFGQELSTARSWERTSYQRPRGTPAGAGAARRFDCKRNLMHFEFWHPQEVDARPLAIITTEILVDKAGELRPNRGAAYFGSGAGQGAG